MAEHDLVIRGATIIDGAGAPARRGDVAVDGAHISAVGTVDGKGRDELDAGGLTVIPGFVDIHTHYDGQVTWDPYLTPSCWQGVTTAVMGNCGVGFAPVRPDKREWLIALMEGVEDIPGTALHEGIRWDWESFPEYLDAIGKTDHAIDIAAQVPHAALRGYVMGDRGAQHTERPTHGEIDEMGRLAAEALMAGALGFTTSRTVNHKDTRGNHTPTLTAPPDELLGIARAIGMTGRGVLEVVCDFGDFESEFALLRTMAEVSGRPLSITTAQLSVNPRGHWQRLLGAIEQAVADGVSLRGQVAARPVGMIMSLDGRVHPLLRSASYRSVAHHPIAERARLLQRPELRSAILAELAGLDTMPGPSGDWDNCFVLGDPADYAIDATKSLGAEARRSGTSPLDLAYDALVAFDGMGSIYVPVANFDDRNLAATRAMLVHPLTVPGLGDGGAHCTIIADASFPTFLLAYWGRDAPDDQRIPLEFLVKRQCADTAAIVGLHDRGLIAPGYKADLNLIDFERLSISRPTMAYDLPANGKRLVQTASGYVATIVSGQVAFRDGETSGALPGRLVRGAQPAPVR